MRVEPEPSLSLGDRIELAIHVRAREQPLVVAARVARDDGEDGLALTFDDLSPQAHAYLERMVKFLPILAMRDGEGLIVSEILERCPAEAGREAQAPAS